MNKEFFLDEDHDQENSEYLLPPSLQKFSDDEILIEIDKIKAELGKQLVVLGHHYQQDDIIRFSDITGDSLKLAQEAAKLDTPYILFCGVHFMAETADMLSKEYQKVILPDLRAGCSMADMADERSIRQAWSDISSMMSIKESELIPITYINCTAALKSFVGEKGGTICTSSNAKKIISWALEKGEKLLFFPDQHLGRNTCVDLGIPLDKMVIYDPRKKNGGLTQEDIKNARVILWYGYCSVHQGFTAEQVDQIRTKHPKMQIIVHPECDYSVVSKADQFGSTAQLISIVEQAPAGSEFAIATEINLVQRLAKKHTDKKIISLSPYQCLCATMYRVRPRWLLASLLAIKAGNPINVISVDEKTTKNSLIALNRMLEIS